MDLFGKTIQSLDTSLDYASLKNQTISNNIANADTPGYKAETVSFKSVLEDTLNSSFATKVTNEKHIDFSVTSDTATPFTVTKETGTSYNNNENNVDIDSEMSELADNQLYYQALADRISGKFNSLSMVIKGGS